MKNLALAALAAALAWPACSGGGGPSDTDTGTGSHADSDTGSGTETDNDTEPELCPPGSYDCVPEGMCTPAGGAIHDSFGCGSGYECCDWEADTDTTPGGVSGTVHYGLSENPAVGFEVRAYDQENDTVGSDESDGEGHFAIELPSGLYLVSADGWEISGDVSNVPVPAGVWVEVDIAVSEVDKRGEDSPEPSR